MHAFSSFRRDLFRKPLLNLFWHIEFYIPKFSFSHVPVHDPQYCPNNFSRVYIVIELKLCVHPSCKLLFFEFLGFIPEGPAVIIHPFNQKGQLCREINRFFCRKPVPDRVQCAPKCLICTILALPFQLAQNIPEPYIG